MTGENHGISASANPLHGPVVPQRMTALCAAWAGDSDIADAIWDVGSLYALDGESLQVLLDDVDVTRKSCQLPQADLALVRSLALAWSEATLGRYTRLTCTDPLTGLATAQHLQTQVASLSRARGFGAWALVIVEIEPRMSSIDTASVPGSMFELISLPEVAALVAREVTEDVTVARLTSRRCAALVPREEASGLVTRVDGRIQDQSRATRIWIERLPDEPTQAASLINELCR